MLHQKEALICWLLKFVLSCTIINNQLHLKMVKSSSKSTKIWSSLGRISVASKSVLLFGATQDKIFQSVFPITKIVKIRCRVQILKVSREKIKFRETIQNPNLSRESGIYIHIQGNIGHGKHFKQKKLDICMTNFHGEIKVQRINAKSGDQT